MVKKLLVFLSLSSIGIIILSGCSQEDNIPIEPPVVFYPDGNWSFQKSVAIGTTTFNGPLYKLRIPFCETTNAGTIIIGTDVREGTTSDQTKISIGIVRSTDGGRSFSDAQIIIPHTELSEWDRAMDGTILVDKNRGRIFVFAHRVTSTYVWENVHTAGDYGFSCEYVFSDDDGMTWSKPKMLWGALDSKLQNVVSMFGGVGHGITMKDGTLVLPIQCKMAMEDNPNVFNIQSGIIYSKDGGTTWLASETLVPCYSSESMVVEYEPGKLMINCKSYIGLRRVFTTSDLGKTWNAHISDTTLIEPKACQGTLHKAGKWGFFLNPMNSKTRSNLTLQITEDFVNWKPVIELEEEKGFGYSCICNWGSELYAVLETNGESIMFYKIDNQ